MMPENNPFEAIEFDPKTHTYTLDGHVLTSVTRKVKTVTAPFDAPAIAAKVAQKKGTTAEAVLANWNASREYGEQVHDSIQTYLSTGMLLNNAPEITQFLNWWDKFSEAVQPISVYALEWVVGDKDLGLGGRIDCLLHCPDDDTYILLDWKTGKYHTKNHFDTLKPPFDHLPSCHHYQYSLQLRLYGLILRRAGLKVTNYFIIHLTPHQYKGYLAHDFGPRFETWAEGA